MGIIVPDLYEIISASGVDRVIVGRHAKAELDESDPEAVVRYSLKQDDPGLSEDGRKAAEASREVFEASLVHGGKYVCVSSPLKRAIETVRAIAPHARICPDDRLEAAAYEYLPDALRAWARKEITSYEIHKMWRASAGFHSTLYRVIDAITSFLSNYEEPTVVAMGHMEICSLVVCLLVGVMPQRFLEAEADFQVPRGKFVTLVRDPMDEWFAILQPPPDPSPMPYL